jgi:hypothetical protein
MKKLILGSIVILSFVNASAATSRSYGRAMYTSCLINESRGSNYRENVFGVYDNFKTYQFTIVGLNFYKDAYGKVLKQEETLYHTVSSESSSSVKGDAQDALESLVEQRVCP